MSSSTPDLLVRSKGFVIALGAAAGGLVLGAALGITGVLDLVGEDATVAVPAKAPFYDCPAGSTTGVLVRGDRVFATGRDATGEWIEVRSPRDSNARAWMRASQLTPDSDLGLLPIIPCAEPAVATVEPAETTTTVPATTTTLVATTTTAVPTTTTTLPAAPTVGTITKSRDPIWEENTPPTCNSVPTQYTTTVVSAAVSAPAGVDAVVMLWSVGDLSGQVTMTLSSGLYRAELGPFDAADPDVVPYQQELPVTITVRVTDDLDRTATGNTTVTLKDCTFG